MREEPSFSRAFLRVPQVREYVDWRWNQLTEARARFGAIMMSAIIS